MTVGIYSPYLHVFGGGERYVLSIAQSLSKRFSVDLFAGGGHVQKAKDIFHLSLEKVNIIPPDTFTRKNTVERFIKLKAYDAFFFMTDGSLFIPCARTNFLIIQSPQHVPPVSLWQSVKLYGWDVIVYSNFMRDIIKKRLGKDARILPPMIDNVAFGSVNHKKERIILSVGRFFRHLHNKKHEVLIEVFKDNYERYFLGWKLIIAGGTTDEKSNEVVEDLRTRSKGFPIEIQSNVQFSGLVSLYGKASIYWHAAGFGEDLEAHPERAEHFGITTLEAMSSGCVPVVFNGGGQKDIITDGKNGYAWNTKKELIDKTMNVIKDEKIRMELSKRAVERSKDFSTEKFEGRLKELMRS